MAIGITLTGVAGLRIFPHSEHFRALDVKIDRDVLMVPEVVVDDLTTPAAAMVRPALDMLWNAGGFARSPHYDEQGSWLNLRG